LCIRGLLAQPPNCTCALVLIPKLSDSTPSSGVSVVFGWRALRPPRVLVILGKAVCLVINSGKPSTVLRSVVEQTHTHTHTAAAAEGSAISGRTNTHTHTAAAAEGSAISGRTNTHTHTQQQPKVLRSAVEQTHTHTHSSSSRRHVEYEDSPQHLKDHSKTPSRASAVAGRQRHAPC
jgi:hypothetical protein